jgi:hypothetical protein
MKKLFTILCATILFLGVSAQTEAGTMLLEGGSDLNFTSLNISSISVDGEDVELPDDLDGTSELGLNVAGAYFLMDGLAAGLVIDYSSSSSGDYSSSSMTIGPMVRYYIGESGLWGQASYGMGSSTEKYDGDSEDGPSISLLAFGAGYALYLSDNISLNPSLGYVMATATQDDGVEVKTKMGGIVFSTGLTLHLGN